MSSIQQTEILIKYIPKSKRQASDSIRYYAFELKEIIKHSGHFIYQKQNNTRVDEAKRHSSQTWQAIHEDNISP